MAFPARQEGLNAGVAKKDLAICLSLVNLCFLNVWQPILDPRANYFRKLYPFSTLIAPHICAECLLALACWAAAEAARRLRHPMFLGAARFAFLFLVLDALNVIRWHVLGWSGTRLGLRAPASLLVEAAAGILCGAAVFLYNRRASRLAALALLALFPLVPIVWLRAAWFLHGIPPARAFAARTLAPALQPRPGSPRVVWIVFDELDQYVAFDHRPAWLRLPEFDRLRAESFSASHASAPASQTALSMPGLISGRQVTAFTMERIDDLTLTPADGSAIVRWSELPNVFSRARALGFNTALAGWDHPYCRIFNGCLTECVWEPAAANGKEEFGRRPDLLSAVAGDFREQALTIPFLARAGVLREGREQRRIRIAKFEALRDTALRMAGDGALGLVMLHLPAPHPPGIYNHVTQQLTWREPSDYLENLALTDRTLGEIRRAAGDRAILMVSSDHPWRAPGWSQVPLWTEREAAASGTYMHSYVPFLVRLPDAQPYSYEQRFNTVISGDLAIALLKGELRDGADLARRIASLPESWR